MPTKTKIAGSISLRALAIGSTFLPAGLILAPAPASAQIFPGTCTFVAGLLDCAGTSTGVVDFSGSVDPVEIILQDGFSSAYTITASTVGGADIVLDSLGNTVLTTTGPGLDLDSSGSVIASITGVTTAGDNAAAVTLRAVDEAIFTSDGLIQTTGNNSDAVNIQGSSVTADLGDVLTTGTESDGVEILSTSGPIIVTADVIETDGDLSGATILRGTGTVGLTANAIRTGGTDAVAIDISTDAAACILLAAGGCDVTAAVDEVTTDGFGGTGALIAATGDTNVNIGVLRTGGDEAAGLDLSADPAACVVLGVGACDTSFTVNELTTEGARSPGAIVRGAGDIDADVGVLRTGGDEAVGLDLASDPTACAILGAGACDTSFSVGELTTSGDGATGLLIRSAGATSGDVGILRTSGDDAAGADIAADPTTCVLLGAGACDVGFTADEVSTEGDGAAAVLIDTVGNVTTDLGLVSTDGDDSTGLGITLAPASCLALGPGSCAVAAEVDDVDTDGDNSPGVDVDGGEDPIDVDTGTVDTGGDNSPGIEVDGTGPITVTAGTVVTAGDNSPGIDVDGDDDPIRVTFASITTLGDASPGVIVSGEGIIDVLGGDVSTAGVGSDGVIVDGGDGPVTVDVGAVTTTGAGSDGIDVTTDAGAQLILAGPVRVSGLGANGIVAASVCGDISITARDDVTAVDGTAILASSGCGVSVTTLPGAVVAGADAGIDITSGTGATILIGDEVSSAAGPAINADGGPADVTIAATGRVLGRIDLTDADDLLANDGLFAASGDSDFGAGVDVLVNGGTVRAAGNVGLLGLESFANEGLIDLVDQAADDSLTIAGDFVGGAGSGLAVDVQASVAGTPADRLVIAGAASGTTTIGLNLLGTPAVFNPDGVIIVDAASAPAGAFALDGAYRSGLVDYSLRQDAAGDAFLFALPNELALEPLLLAQLGQTFWYQSADAWSQSAAFRRDQLAAGTGRDTSFWIQAYGGTEEAGATQSVDVFGEVRDTDLRFDTDLWGVQAGVDFRSSNSLGFGLTGGYESADSDFASGTGADLKGWNIGAYMLYAPPSGLYAELLAKADFFDVELENGALFQGADMDGKSYGIEGEVGYRIVTGGMHVDLGAALAYVHTDLDGFEASGANFDFDGAESIRGRIGVRVASNSSGLAPFADLKLLHEFEGDNEVRLASGGFILPLRDAGRGTWGRAEVGLSGNLGGAGAFLSAWGELGDVEGYGLRAGIRW